MKLRKLKPSFEPLIIEFDTQLEIQLINCISNFLCENVDAKNALKRWYSTYYLDSKFNQLINHDEQDIYTSMSLMLINLSNLSHDKLKENNNG